MRKYILHPGYVISKSDGDSHYISAERLAGLYGLQFGDCVVRRSDRHEYYRSKPGDIDLYPRSDGNYRLPENRHAM